MEALMVFLGAALGAPARYLTDRYVQSRHTSDFPWGTLTVNVAGCFLLGLLAGASSTWMPLLGTGFCGGLTTYSTFGYETVRLLERREFRFGLLNVVVSIALGVGAARLGYLLAA
ncbi:putative fluoride ion transporter CrcB 2 [Lentzea sp. NBRC 105346]|uniref:fluoride efflux transporter CrcB n=1 Tax=Lentzea sp. NBRC 105346 TaxID=3032205 RepID=UPI00255551A3|nr:fluoride efflux transporter CrcB [Lentzea sp. NBRC 105346]GLZ33895.1 putative fluoride ion transporter CrcB 2 [Lentzea sp. NBRC 105346]